MEEDMRRAARRKPHCGNSDSTALPRPNSTPRLCRAGHWAVSTWGTEGKKGASFSGVTWSRRVMILIPEKECEIEAQDCCGKGGKQVGPEGKRWRWRRRWRWWRRTRIRRRRCRGRIRILGCSGRGRPLGLKSVLDPHISWISTTRGHGDVRVLERRRWAPSDEPSDQPNRTEWPHGRHGAEIDPRE